VLYDSADTLRVGVISDVHGDARALDRALSLLERLQVHRVVCLGDLVEKGSHGDLVVEALAQHLIPSVQGNHDENAVRHGACFRGADDDEEAPLAASTLRALAELPPRREYLWLGRRLILAHGIPAHNGVGVRVGEVPKALKRALRYRPADALLLGHTHQPLRTRVNGVWIFNPGSVCRQRARDSHSLGVLTLPSLSFEVVGIDTGETLDLDSL
jgi:protein phosphatase